MSLKQWADNGWLKPHQTSKQEIADLLNIVRRDVSDAGKDLSDDWRFGIAYNAALKLCTILLYAEGYRASQGLQHYRTVMSLPFILGSEKEEDAHYLNTCRGKRNIVEYESVGEVTKNDADELLDFVKGFKSEVMQWLKKNHADLI